MSLEPIRDGIELYINRALTDFTKNSTDLVTVALNHARKRAERAHDFTCTRVEAKIVLDAYSGALMSDATLTDDEETAVDLRSIKGAFYSGDGLWRRPMQYKLKDTLVQTIQDSDDAVLYNDDVRYPGDWQPNCGLYTLVKSGLRLYVYPGARVAGTDVTVYLDAYKWMEPYEDEDSEDWFSENASEYLMWQAIVELNHLAKEFVPRQQGNLTPPQDRANEALATLIATDVGDEQANTDWEQYL